MKLNVAITCPRELDLKGTDSAEVSLTISNQSGGALKVKADAVAIDASLNGCLEIVKGERFWEFADKGTHNITVRVKAPANAVNGEAKFRLVLADQATPDEAGAEGPEIKVLVGVKTPVIVKPFPWWIVAVAAAALLVIGGGLWLLLKDRRVEVPDVVGKTIQEAQTLLEEIGLKGVAGEAVPAPGTNQIAVGRVAVQDPEATELVEKGTEVKLHPKVNLPKMPNLMGKNVSTVLGQLSGYRLGPTTQRRTPGKRPPGPLDGTVLDQDPKPGEEVTPDKVVTLVLEGEPKTLTWAQLKTNYALKSKEAFKFDAAPRAPLPPAPGPAPRKLNQ